MEEKDEHIIRTKEDADRFFWRKNFFAFIDILGFKQLVTNNSHDELVTLYKSLVNFQVDFYKEYLKKEEELRKEKLGEFYEPSTLRLVNISDSILLWTSNTNEKSLIELSFAVKSLMRLSMEIGIPLRGSIVKGDIEIFENENTLSIVGLGLVKAYENESKQNWSGCTIEDGIFSYLRSIKNVVQQIPGPHKFDKLNSLFVKTEIPYKTGTREGYVINWADQFDFDETKIITAFEAHKKRVNEDEKRKLKVDEIIENTLQFLIKFK